MATSTLSRAEYLKRYMNSSADSADRPKKKKKSKELAGTTSGKGMRLLDEDTYGQQNRPGTSKQRHRRRPQSDEEDENEFDEEDGEEEMDEIERAIRRMNRRTGSGRKANAGAEEPTFKAGSFVTIDGPDGEQSADGEQQIEPVIKKEPKEEPLSEEEETIGQHQAKRRRMDDGRRAGLVHKQAMKEEMRELQEQREQHRKKTADEKQESGEAGGETRKRVTGFNRDARKRREGGDKETDEKAEAEKEARKKREEAKQAEMEQKYTKWNKGVAQLKEREERMEEMERTLQEGFTRYADDSAMNEHLRDQLHEEDPMAEYFRVKNRKIQMRSGLVYPTYTGQCPPNRHGIAPGYRWDGVDRSNGFEAKMALEKNRKLARQKDTYRAIAECEQ